MYHHGSWAALRLQITFLLHLFSLTYFTFCNTILFIHTIANAWKMISRTCSRIHFKCMEIEGRLLLWNLVYKKIFYVSSASSASNPLVWKDVPSKKYYLKKKMKIGYQREKYLLCTQFQIHSPKFFAHLCCWHFIRKAIWWNLEVRNLEILCNILFWFFFNV